MGHQTEITMFFIQSLKIFQRYKTLPGNSNIYHMSNLNCESAKLLLDSQLRPISLWSPSSNHNQMQGINLRTHTQSNTHTPQCIHPVWHRPHPELTSPPSAPFPPFVLAAFHRRSSEHKILFKLPNASSFSGSFRDKKSAA